MLGKLVLVASCRPSARAWAANAGGAGWSLATTASPPSRAPASRASAASSRLAKKPTAVSAATASVTATISRRSSPARKSRQPWRQARASTEMFKAWVCMAGTVHQGPQQRPRQGQAGALVAHRGQGRRTAPGRFERRRASLSNPGAPSGCCNPSHGHHHRHPGPDFSVAWLADDGLDAGRGRPVLAAAGRGAGCRQPATRHPGGVGPFAGPRAAADGRRQAQHGA